MDASLEDALVEMTAKIIREKLPEVRDDEARALDEGASLFAFLSDLVRQPRVTVQILYSEDFEAHDLPPIVSVKVTRTTLEPNGITCEESIGGGGLTLAGALYRLRRGLSESEGWAEGEATA